MRSLFTKCAHVWGDVKGTYRGPNTQGFSSSGFVDFSMILSHMYGTSELHQTCTRCSQTRTVRVPGRTDLTRLAFPTEYHALTRRVFQKCEHEFTAPTATFSPPQGRPGRMSGMVSENMIRFVLEGLSTLTQFCTHCHEVRAVVRIGQYENAEPLYRSVAA
jgi:hypothetical protein